jgi:hypothetical protein
MQKSQPVCVCVKQNPVVNAFRIALFPAAANYTIRAASLAPACGKQGRLTISKQNRDTIPIECVWQDEQFCYLCALSE